jgi:S-adenosylmethionine/arginine decarboxylase-like enzyme
MKNIAPQIFRKRLLVEAKYQIDINEKVINDFFKRVSEELDLRVYDEPIVHITKGGKDINQGFDAFAPLVDSGISIYIWTGSKFLSCILFTCKDFSSEKAIQFIKEFFETSELEHQEF